MQPASGYTTLPGGAALAAHERGRLALIVNGVAVPLVPLACALLFLAGLPMWAAGMLTARSTTGGIFADLGLEADSLDRLKATVLAAVLVLTPLAAALLAANLWLEASRPGQPGRVGTGLALSEWTTTAGRVCAANWAAQLVLALALAGSVTWLVDMSAALATTRSSGGGGGPSPPPWWPPAAAAAPAPAPAPPPARAPAVAPAAAVAAMARLPAAERLGGLGVPCPPGCVDLGLIASVLGLPWACFCQTWLLAGLAEQLSRVVLQLWVAVVGALLLFVACSLLFGCSVAQHAHAERDLRGALAEPAAQAAA